MAYRRRHERPKGRKGHEERERDRVPKGDHYYHDYHDYREFPQGDGRFEDPVPPAPVENDFIIFNLDWKEIVELSKKDQDEAYRKLHIAYRQLVCMLDARTFILYPY